MLRQKPLHVHIAETFPLKDVADAHRLLERHYLGKIALSVASEG